MKELVIGALFISVLFIIWDLTKSILTTKEKEAGMPVLIGAPGKDRIERYAEVFEQLAGTFGALPYRKEKLNETDMEEIFQEVSQRLCAHCSKHQSCWKKDYFATYQAAYEILSSIEESGKDISLEVQESFEKRCLHANEFLSEMIQIFHRARLNLMWNNKLLENRIAVSEQLSEMSKIMTDVAESIYHIKNPDHILEGEIRRILKRNLIEVKYIYILENQDKKQEIFVTMRCKKGRCISTKELGNMISKTCEQIMVPSRGSRSIVNQEYSTVLFIEDTHFQVLNGVARVTKEGERISGDNFTFATRDCGQVIMSLSDGMGTGVRACKESEMVIELLEQFLEAGFKKETAVKLINSAMVIQGANQSFSTIDLCTIDLYSGVGEFLKIGAASTFIKREHSVEVITSTSLPAGILQEVDYDSTSKKLYHGDFVIMVSDGVLDALPPGRQEEIMQEIITQSNCMNAEEAARSILERVLVYNKCKVMDDMTVLVSGVWQK